MEQVERTVPCPGGCGGEVTWTYHETRKGTKIPPAPDECSDCAAARELSREAQQAEIIASERRQRIQDREERMLDILAALGVNTAEHGWLRTPNGLLPATLDNLEAVGCPAEPLEEARTWVRRVREAGRHDPVRGLYLWGETGSGKTQILVATIRELLRDPDWQSDWIRFDNATSLISEVQSCYSTGRDDREVKKPRQDTRILGIDDLGTERPREDPARILYEILNARVLRPTITTSNYPPDVLEKRPGFERIASRLGPECFRVVHVVDRDHRFG